MIKERNRNVMIEIMKRKLGNSGWQKIVNYRPGYQKRTKENNGEKWYKHMIITDQQNV